MPPARTHDGEDAARDDDPDEADHGQHAEDVDPRGHEGRLPVGSRRSGGKADSATRRIRAVHWRSSAGDGEGAFPCRRSSASSLVPRERNEDGQDEDDDHQDDDDEVRPRELYESPMDVVPGSVEIDQRPSRTPRNMESPYARTPPKIRDLPPDVSSGASGDRAGSALRGSPAVGAHGDVDDVETGERLSGVEKSCHGVEMPGALV